MKRAGSPVPGGRRRFRRRGAPGVPGGAAPRPPVRRRGAGRRVRTSHPRRPGSPRRRGGRGLVGAAGFEAEADEGRQRQLLDRPGLGGRLPRVPAPAAVALRVPGIPSDRRFEASAGGEAAQHQGEIALFHLAAGEGLDEAEAARVRCGRRRARRWCPGRGGGRGPGGPADPPPGFPGSGPRGRSPACRRSGPGRGGPRVPPAC